MGIEVEFRTRSSTRALLSTLISPFIHIVSLIVFGFFDLVDQVLCPVFSYLDWLLDRREGSCYCHEEFEAENNKLAASGAGVVTDCEFWEGRSNTLYSRRHKHGRSRVHFLTLHRSLSLETTEPLKLFNSRCADLISGRNLWRSCDSVSLDEPGLVLNVEKNYSADTGVSARQLSSGQTLLQRESPEIYSPKARWSDCGCTTCTAWHTSEDLYVRLSGKG